MYKELLIAYERSNLNDDNLIKLGQLFAVDIDEQFIEDKIFFGCEGKYEKAHYGTGSIYIFKKRDSEELILINTYLLPQDQFEMMEIGVRCKNENFDNAKELLSNCFEEETLKPLKEKIVEYDNNLLLKISTMGEVPSSIFYDGAGPGNLVKVERANV